VRDVLLYYSGAPERHSGRQIPVAGGVDLTFYEPLGVVGIIVPWNFPMPIAGWGLGPALAAGNTVVLKPATLTPLTALRLGELALEAGVPEGVFQVVDRRRRHGRTALRHPPGDSKDLFHGIQRRGSHHYAGLRRAGEASHFRTWWARARTSSSRTPISKGPRRAPPTPSLTMRARTAVRGHDSLSKHRPTSGS